MRKFLVIISLIIFAVLTEVSAQNYKLATGFRIGYPTAINGKYFLNQSDAVEGLLAFYRGGFELSAFYEIHDNAFEIPFLNWYYGGGLHLGAFSANVARPAYLIDSRGDGFTTGLDGIIGLEYRMTDRPFIFGVDIKPSMDFLPNPHFYLGGAISFRVYF